MKLRMNKIVSDEITTASALNTFIDSSRLIGGKVTLVLKVCWFWVFVSYYSF